MITVSKPLLNLRMIGGLMYKIREAAKLLNVETIDIHKKLISLKKDLLGHVHKKNGIISIDQEGIDIISLSFAGVKTESVSIYKAAETSSEEDGPVSLNEETNKMNTEEGFTKNLVSEVEVQSELNVLNVLDERDLNSIKNDINSKKSQLNVLNQKIVTELERTEYYTIELNNLHDRIKKHLT